MRALVAHASKHGSTAEIAEAVAESMRGAGVEVDCRSAGEVDSVEEFDAVVLGSAVYMKRWRGDARRLLRANRKALREMPFWVFSSGPVGDPAEDDPSWTEPPKVIRTVEKLGCRGHVVFGGRVPQDPHGPIEKAMANGIPEEFHDRRDWDEIRSWGARVARELGAAPQAGSSPAR